MLLLGLQICQTGIAADRCDQFVTLKTTVSVYLRRQTILVRTYGSRLRGGETMLVKPFLEIRLRPGIIQPVSWV